MKARVPVPPARPVVSVSKSSSRDGSSASRRSKAPQNLSGNGSSATTASTRCRPAAIYATGQPRRSPASAIDCDAAVHAHAAIAAAVRWTCVPSAPPLMRAACAVVAGTAARLPFELLQLGQRAASCVGILATRRSPAPPTPVLSAIVATSSCTASTGPTQAGHPERQSQRSTSSSARTSSSPCRRHNGSLCPTPPG